MKKILTIGSAIFGAVFVALASSQLVSAQNIIIPAYNYPMTWQSPTPYWDDITTAGGSQVPLVIFNPASGPGVAANPDYQTQIDRNILAGVKNVAYVAVDYQAKDMAEVLDEIDRYQAFYGVDKISGIFLDQVEANNPAQLCYLSTVYNYIKTTYPNLLVMGNPGVHISDSYAPYADIWITFESDYDTYDNLYTQPASSFENDPANYNRIMHMVHNTSGTDYSNALSLASTRNAGWVYITDDVLANPYDALPSYFSAMLAEIPNTTTIPNRSAQLAYSGCDDPYALTATQDPEEDDNDSGTPGISSPAEPTDMDGLKAPNTGSPARQQPLTLSTTLLAVAASLLVGLFLLYQLSVRTTSKR